ncbi:sigma-54 interaction domain-containing protein [Alteribacillus sp. JSM 102045]|uniref:sigma-54 interaction domain-containing protein n=1 Tax=Alteribacillus sp. JSM 102045 TaxID=1562101 RepID=UPI0035C234E3
MNFNHSTPLIVYETLLDKMDLGIRVIDRSETPIIYNTKMRVIESMTIEDFSDKPITEVFPFKDKRDSRLFQALYNNKTIKNKKQTYYNNKGDEITTVNHTFPIKEKGQTIAAAEIATDVTQLEKMRRDSIIRRTDTRYTFESLIGSSSAIREVKENAKKATRTSSSILLVGETGTGKELFAQSIHNGSSRSGPYISQNCAALPETLIESLLFGTVKGAFTGAVERSGLFEEAEGGTLMLDEINTLPTSLQAKLLRVIQERKIKRIGDNKERPIDVRIIATINEDPLDAITHKRLRKDLYYRLGVVTLFIPPLRERLSDIPELADSFISKYNQYFQMQVLKIDHEVKEIFNQYLWPGNIRELEHVIEGAMNMVLEENTITAAHLPPHFRNKTELSEMDHTFNENQEKSLEKGESLRDRLYKTELTIIKQSLSKNNYNIMRTAKDLGISRQSLQYRMEKFQLK